MSASIREKNIIDNIYNEVRVGDKLEWLGDLSFQTVQKGTIVELVPCTGWPRVQLIKVRVKGDNYWGPKPLGSIERFKYLKVNGIIVWNGVKDFKEAQQKKEKEQKAESNKPETAEYHSDNSMNMGGAGAAAGCGVAGCLGLITLGLLIADSPIISGVCWRLSKKLNISVVVIRFIIIAFSWTGGVIFSIPIYFILARRWKNKIKMMQSESGES